MRIIMRRDSVIFYSENNRIGNALRRCLLNRNLRFLLRNSIRHSENLHRPIWYCAGFLCIRIGFSVIFYIILRIKSAQQKKLHLLIVLCLMEIQGYCLPLFVIFHDDLIHFAVGTLTANIAVSRGYIAISHIKPLL